MWKDIKGYEGMYQVSDRGEIKSLSRVVECKSSLSGFRRLKGYSLKVSKSTQGYTRIMLCSGVNKHTTHLVHRLVAQAFIDNPNNKPEVNHISGEKMNNNVSNLEWATTSENRQHAYNTKLHTPKRGSEWCRSKLTENDVLNIREQYSRGVRVKDIVKNYNVTDGCISAIVRRVNWRHI